MYEFIHALSHVLVDSANVAVKTVKSSQCLSFEEYMYIVGQT